MEAKKTLAADIVTTYYGADAAKTARIGWEQQFSQKQDPDNIPEGIVSQSEMHHGQIGIAKMLVLLALAKSNNEARQKLQEGAVSVGRDARNHRSEGDDRCGKWTHRSLRQPADRPSEVSLNLFDPQVFPLLDLKAARAFALVFQYVRAAWQLASIFVRWYSGSSCSGSAVHSR